MKEFSKYGKYHTLYFVFYSANHQWGEIHGVLLTVAWFGLENIGLWALHFKSKAYSQFIHIFCMASAAALMFIGCMIELVVFGPRAIYFRFYHMTWGFVLMCIIPFLLLSGSVCKISQNSPYTKPEKVSFNNKAHSLFGWTYLFLVKVPLLSKWYFNNVPLYWVIIAVTVCSYSLFLYFKFFGQKITDKITEK